MSLPLEKLPPKPVSGLKLTIGMLLIAALAGGTAFWGISARATNVERLNTRAQEAAVPTVLVVNPTKAADSLLKFELPGRVEPFTRAPIYSRIAGYLKSWKVDIGAVVKAGQLLAEIETPELDQQIAQAQAELASVQANAALSRATAERWQSLRDQGFVSSQAVEERKGDLQVKESQAKASQANLDRLIAQKRFSLIVAPFDGVITSRSTDVGALVVAGGAANTELFTLSDVSRIRIYVNIPRAARCPSNKGTAPPSWCRSIRASPGPLQFIRWRRQSGPAQAACWSSYRPTMRRHESCQVALHASPSNCQGMHRFPCPRAR